MAQCKASLLTGHFRVPATGLGLRRAREMQMQAFIASHGGHFWMLAQFDAGGRVPDVGW